MFLKYVFVLLNIFGRVISGVNFISIHLGNVPSIGYMAIAPAVATAFDETVIEYPELSSNYSWTPQIMAAAATVCDLGNNGMIDSIGQLYQKGVINISETTVVFVAGMMIVS